MSVKEPFETGTRIPHPPIFILGNILLKAFAAPVVVGIIEFGADLALLKSWWFESCKFWSVVYEWTVVTYAFSISKESFRIFIIGAAQFVVHEAFEIINPSY